MTQDVGDVVERLDRYAKGIVDFHIHEIVPEAGGGWSLTEDLGIVRRGGAQQLYPDGLSLTEDDEIALLDALERVGAKGHGFVVLEVPCDYEDDWYEPNGPAPQLVAEGGPFLRFDKARLTDPAEVGEIVAAKDEIERLRSDMKTANDVAQTYYRVGAEALGHEEWDRRCMAALNPPPPSSRETEIA